MTAGKEYRATADGVCGFQVVQGVADENGIRCRGTGFRKPCTGHFDLSAAESVPCAKNTVKVSGQAERSNLFPQGVDFAGGKNRLADAQFRKVFDGLSRPLCQTGVKSGRRISVDILLRNLRIRFFAKVKARRTVVGFDRKGENFPVSSR